MFWIKLLVPWGIQSTADIESLSIETQLQHLRRPIKPTAFDKDWLWLFLINQNKN